MKPAICATPNAYGKSEIRTFKCTKVLVTSYPWAYVSLENNPRNQMGIFKFKKDLKLELRTIQGYSGFILWIDGIKVSETSLNHLEYYYTVR